MLPARHRHEDERGWFDWWAALYCDESFGLPERWLCDHPRPSWDRDVAAAWNDQIAFAGEDDYPYLRWPRWRAPLLSPARGGSEQARRRGPC